MCAIKAHKKTLYFLLALAACILLLAGCGKPEPAVQTYTVRFTVMGTVCSEQTVTKGALPKKTVSTPQGLQLQAWLDEAGNVTDPFATPVLQDTQYTALAYPELMRHTPYLFTDETGALRPDEALTADELRQALQALAAPGAADFFPTMPAGSQPIDANSLKGVLENFFTKDAVQSAFPGAEDGSITRTAFAFGMNTLLDWNASETMALKEDSVLPADLTWSREDIVCLLEASVAHISAVNGNLWEQTQIPTVFDTGFVHKDGWLYRVDENGCYLRDAAFGTLYFGADGRYTSGDEELDAIVVPILASIQAAAPDATLLEWLRSAYEYSRDSFDYLRRDAYEFGATGWEIDTAKGMFQTGRGNCYSYAAAFWALARGLGYDARAISGTCLRDEQPHSWVFIEIEGADYLFDPEWEMVYREQREDFTKDMFMLPMSKIGWWTYRWQQN